MIYFQAAFSPPTGVLRLDSLDSLSVDGKETYVLDDGYPDENDDGWDTDLEIDGTVEWYVAWTFDYCFATFCPYNAVISGSTTLRVVVLIVNFNDIATPWLTSDAPV